MARYFETKLNTRPANSSNAVGTRMPCRRRGVARQNMRARRHPFTKGHGRRRQPTVGAGEAPSSLQINGVVIPPDYKAAVRPGANAAAAGPRAAGWVLPTNDERMLQLGSFAEPGSCPLGPVGRAVAVSSFAGSKAWRALLPLGLPSVNNYCTAVANRWRVLFGATSGMLVPMRPGGFWSPVAAGAGLTLGFGVF